MSNGKWRRRHSTQSANRTYKRAILEKQGRCTFVTYDLEARKQGFCGRPLPCAAHPTGKAAP